jgi:flagellar motor switch protein FliN
MSLEQTSNIRTRAAPPTAQVISLGELHGEVAQRSAAALDNANPLHSVRARLQVCVGEAELSVGELLAAKEHQILVLDRTVDQPVDMLLEGKVVARGQLVAVDGRFAVRITELPLPLKT